MSKTLYKVRTAPGFNAGQRTRAGIRLQKGQAQILELTKEQLAALEADVWIQVSEAGEGAKPTAAGESAPEDDNLEDTVTDPYEGVSFKDLKTKAEEAGLDTKGLKSRASVIDVLNQNTAGGTAYEEHVTDGIRYFKEGDKIAAVEDEGFTDFENSLAGFGDTEVDALAELRKAQELADNLEYEEIEISEDMSLEDLKTIATDQGVDAEVVEAAGEDDKAELIKAIEEASAKTEE